MIDETKVIEVEYIDGRYNTLRSIRDLIAEAKTKSEDLSEVYVYVKQKNIGSYTISLNLLIIRKIIFNSIEVNEEVVEILNQLDPNEEYIISRYGGSAASSLISYAAACYLDHDNKAAFKVLEFFFSSGKVDNLNPMVRIKGEQDPLLFQAIKEAAQGDNKLWRIYKDYIDNAKNHLEIKEIREKLGLYTMLNTDMGRFNALQLVAWAYANRSQELPENHTLFEIAQKLIDLGMNPYQKTNFEGEDQNFFEISTPDNLGLRGWTPIDFGKEEAIEMDAVGALNTLDEIQQFITEQEDKGLDLSNIYIDEGDYGLIPLNLLIIYKIIVNNIDVVEIEGILRKFRQEKEYARYVHDNCIKESAIAYVYSFYHRHHEYKDICLKILEYLFNCGAKVDSPVKTDRGKIPLMFEAIDLAVEGDMRLWDIVGNKITFDFIGINGAKLDLLQYLAYRCRLQGGKNADLDKIVRELIEFLNPEDKIEYINERGERELGGFFEISGDNGWKPEDFGLKYPPLSLRYDLTKKGAFGEEITTTEIDRKIALIMQLVAAENNQEVQEYLSSGDSIRYIGDIPLYLNQKLVERDYSKVFGEYGDTFSKYGNNKYGNRVADIVRDFINNPAGYVDLNTFINDIMSLEDNDVIASLIESLENSENGMFILEELKILKYDPQGVLPHVENINLLFANQDKPEAIYNNENGLKDKLRNLPESVKDIVISKLRLDPNRLNFVKQEGEDHFVEWEDYMRNSRGSMRVDDPISLWTWSCPGFKIGLATTVAAGVILLTGGIVLGIANAGKEPVSFDIIDSLAKISPEMASVFKNPGVQFAALVVTAGIIAGIAALITAAVVQEKT